MRSTWISVVCTLRSAISNASSANINERKALATCKCNVIAGFVEVKPRSNAAFFSLIQPQVVGHAVVERNPVPMPTLLDRMREVANWLVKGSMVWPQL